MGNPLLWFDLDFVHSMYGDWVKHVPARRYATLPTRLSTSRPKWIRCVYSRRDTTSWQKSGHFVFWMVRIYVCMRRSGVSISFWMHMDSKTIGTH